MTTTNLTTLRTTLSELQSTLKDWQNIEPECLALKKVLQLVDANDESLTKLVTVDKDNQLDSIFRQTIDSINDFILRDREGQELWGNMLWKTRRDLLISQHRLNWQATLFEQLNPLMKQAFKLEFPFYTNAEDYKDDMSSPQNYRYYQSLFGQQANPRNMWNTFMTKYQAQFGPWDDITRDCLKYLLCTDKNGTEMNIYGYIAITRDYGFPLDMEKLPLTMLSPPPTPSEQARVETAKMIMDLVTYFSSKEMRDHLVAIYTWYRGCNKKDKKVMQERANEWANVILEGRGKEAENWTEQEKLADKVDLARRTVSLFYQKFMVMWRMGEFARDLFTDVDFPGKARIFEMKECVLPLDHANYHVVIRSEASKWDAKRPKVYKFLDQVIKRQ